MPGELFPKFGPRPSASQAEVNLYTALRAGLPDGWKAWHSLRLRVGNSWEGEADFVIAAPDRGLLVVEVKGGKMELDDGIWRQNGKPLARPPRQQALDFANHLVEAMRYRCVPPPWGVALAFPDVDFSEGPQAGDLAGLVIGRRDLIWLREELPGLLDRAAPSRPMPRERRWLHVLADLWGETWVGRVGPVDQVADAERRLLALDVEQLKMLDFAQDNPRVLVEGGAGSGKTVVAVELCRRWARQGRNVLYLCFTDALARQVDACFEGERQLGRDLRAATVRRFADGLLAQIGKNEPAPDANYWNDVALQAEYEALPPDDERPDLLVIDEAQDLGDGEWVLVDSLSRGRALWGFADPCQRFWTDRAVREDLFEGARLKLLRQHRNPESIARFAGLYASGCEGSCDHAEVDARVLRVVPARDGQSLERVRHEIESLRRLGVKPGDIAILSLAGQTRSLVASLATIGSTAVARADAPDAASKVVGDTFLRFKGLERPYVIVTEVEQGLGDTFDTRMHIALTRATVGVAIVCEQEVAAQDPRLRALLAAAADATPAH